MISKIFLPKMLNIFCDASITSNCKGMYNGCPASIVTTYDNSDNDYGDIIDGDFRILGNTTNNNSEITAILLGVYKALQYRYQFDAINLFSDSEISVNGLKKWIFNWVNNVYKNKMFSSSGTEVANQEMFLRVLNIIITNQLCINIFHQRGHMDIKKPSDIKKATECFKRSNGIDLNEFDIIGICNYNNFVDDFSRTKLLSWEGDIKKVLPLPIYYDPEKQNMNNYKKLICSGGSKYAIGTER